VQPPEAAVEHHGELREAVVDHVGVLQRLVALGRVRRRRGDEGLAQLRARASGTGWSGTRMPMVLRFIIRSFGTSRVASRMNT
jgi:hypothetical protein